MSSEYNIPIVRTLNQEEIDDIVCTAFEGGITYWCDEAKIVGPETEYPEGATYLHEVLTRGRDIQLYESDSKQWHVLSIDKLVDALSKVEIDFDNYDAGDADNVVQMAVFGEVIYG